MSASSDLLQEANRLRPMSLRKRAERIDGRLSFATLGDYQRGTHAENPDEATLQGLAVAYDLPLATLQDAARVPVGAGLWEPPASVSRLTRRQQAALTELINAMAEREGGSSASTGEPGKKTTRGATASVTPMSAKQRRMLERAQDVDRAADDRGRSGEGE